MSDWFALRTLLFTGEMLAGSALVMGIAVLCARQPSASARHLTWAGAFGALLLLPALALVLPSPFSVHMPAQTNANPVRAISTDDSGLGVSRPAEPIALSSAQDARGPGHALSLHGGHEMAAAAAIAMAALWGLGVLYFLMRASIGAVLLAMLRRRSRIYALPADREPIIAAKRREAELRLCADETCPVTFGTFRPMILLPKSALSWSRERISAVLLHELAHVRRKDACVQSIALFVCAFYWPNPLGNGG